MLTIPWKINDDEFSVFVALLDDNIERIKAHDPAQLSTSRMGEPWASLKLRDVHIGFASAEDIIEINRQAAAGEHPRKVLGYLSRGWKFSPEAGDYDGPYKPLRT